MKFGLSLLLLLVSCVGFADVYNDLDNILRTSDRPLQVQQELRLFDQKALPEEAETLRAKIAEYQLAELPSRKEMEVLRGLVAVKLVQRGERPVDVGKVSSRAKEIKKSIEYTSPGKKQQSNWLEKGMKDFFKWVGDALGNLFKFPSWRGPRMAPSGNLSGLAMFFNVVKYLIFAAIFAGLIYLIVHLARNWGIHRIRKAKGLMDEEEEKLSLDEWLARAGALARNGDHRGACRCLYLAMLVRLDDADVMRLIRTETNWEHQRRFDSSKHKPAEWGLRPATQAFDIIWYGQHCKGEEDTNWFRERYDSLLMAIGRRKG